MIKLTSTLLIIAFSVLVSSCTNVDSDTPMPTPAESVQGVSLSPRSFTSDDFLQFMDLVSDAGRYLTWAGDWVLLADSMSGAFVVATLDDQYAYVPIILTSWFKTEDGDTLHEMTDANKLLFMENCAEFARRHRPPMMVLAVELNTAYDHSPALFAEFAATFPAARDSIRSASPNTLVGVDFLWEMMRGLRGGLFGGINDTTNTQFELINEFPTADFIGFNSYPCLVYAHPDSIPADYYSRILDITDKPVAFFECGWHTGDILPGWESSEAEQARFVERYLELLAPLEPLAIIWPFLFDPDIQAPFNSMGLWDRNSNQPKAAWNAWIEE